MGVKQIYETKPLECWGKAKEIRDNYYRDYAKAHDQYGLCIEGVNWLTLVLKGVGQVMGLDYQNIVSNKASVQSYIENLEHIIREMLTAQSDEDWVMLSDLLEYELLPLMEVWKEILPSIEEAARNTEEKTEKQ